MCTCTCTSVHVFPSLTQACKVYGHVHQTGKPKFQVCFHKSIIPFQGRIYTTLMVDCPVILSCYASSIMHVYVHVQSYMYICVLFCQHIWITGSAIYNSIIGTLHSTCTMMYVCLPVGSEPEWGGIESTWGSGSRHSYWTAIQWRVQAWTGYTYYCRATESNQVKIEAVDTV